MKPGFEVDDDAGLRAAARELGTTIFHPAGTAKMGLASDPTAVVDERLRVFGVADGQVTGKAVVELLARKRAAGAPPDVPSGIAAPAPRRRSAACRGR